MANILTVVKSMAGIGDDVGLLTGEIEATRSKGIAASAELERLEASRLVAEDYDAAKIIDARLDRVRFEVDKLAAALPLLENRLSVARAARNRKLLAKHQDIARKILPRLVSAITAAAEIQQESIDARDAAIADLGEGAVQQAIEPIAYMGMLMKPFVAAWAESMQKRLAAPAPQPAVVSPVASRAVVAPQRPIGSKDQRVQAAQPVAPAEPVKPKARRCAPPRSR
jgi:hypothetical protein